VFDVWRGEYNHERPHEALGQRRPATVYTRSRLVYPCRSAERRFVPFAEVTRIDKHGFITWNQRRVLISSALKHEYIELEINPDTDGRWDVRWGEIALGWLDHHRPDRGLVYPRRRRGSSEVSGMSFHDVSGMSEG